MSSQRLTILASVMKDPELAARRITAMFNSIQSQLGAATKNKSLQNITFTTANPVGGTFPIVLPAIGFTPTGVVISQFGLADKSQVSFPTGFAWSNRPEGGIQVDFINGLNVSTGYVMSLEVFGG